MNFNIYKSFCSINTSIGELYLFDISAGDQEKLFPLLEKKSEPELFMKEMLIYICFPKNSLKEGGNKPDKPILTKNDIEKLSKDEIEQISQKYLENNEYLYKKTIEKTAKNSQGVNVLSFDYGEIKYPKKDNESYVQYLYRLATLDLQKLKDDIKRLTLNFSSNVLDSIKKTETLGDSIRQSLGEIRPFHFAAVHDEVKLQTPKLPKFEPIKSPFIEVEKRLSELVETSARTAEFIIKMNETQVQIAGELKNSGDNASYFAKRNIKLNCVIISITLLSLLISLFSAYGSLKVSKTGTMAITQAFQKLNKTFDNFSTKQNELAELRETIISEKQQIQRLQEQIIKLEQQVADEKDQKLKIKTTD